MKISIYILLLLFSSHLVAQKIDLKSLEAKKAISNQSVYPPVNTINIKFMAVYPGCESFTEKKDLIICFNQKLSKDLLKFLDPEFPKLHEPKEILKIALQFAVNTNGEIANIEAIHGDIEIRNQAVAALKKVANSLVKTKKFIQPAKLHDGSYIKFIFQNSVTLLSPDFDVSDWIYVLHKKGYSIEIILSELKLKNINEFSKSDINNYLEGLTKKQKKRLAKDYF